MNQKLQSLLNISYTSLDFELKRSKRNDALSHSMLNKNNSLHHDYISAIVPTKKDLRITARVLRSYQLAIKDEEKIKTAGMDIWSILKKGPHRDLFQTIENGDVPTLALYLCNMTGNGATHGMLQGNQELARLKYFAPYRQWTIRITFDRLLSLAESLGILSVNNPEQGKYGSNSLINVNALVKNINKRLKIFIIPPRLPGKLFALKTDMGALHERDITSVYAAIRVLEVLDDEKKAKVCEIGGGVGKVAYYSRLMGITDYTIIDLPHVNLLQGFYLLQCLPEQSVLLYGEKMNSAQATYVMPYWTFNKYGENRFDLTLNQDSFPEINRSTVIGYLTAMKSNTKKYLLSINQESENTMLVQSDTQNVVHKLVQEVGGFQREYWFPCWVRKGYVEELFSIEKLMS